ncbi:hypothetical protein UFOVP1537_12 [uncultured Caudovirales phage]|uniref:Uncharacterized protein n=2 Tax=root TaxID=1 RepID=A0A6J5QJ68_9CAUD|nr:hypothetical protein UFOVP825_30 [uncultured Caudovirales phage]CAB4171195.1 hypothetical protein UFOVP915_12 [uncultured Caudovirales phage]CAB4177212.1 hypothetical protein UFOVP1000_29 [uncultured Caudovirales phage]CAB4182476.1 hypothetical protein UFOVP1092_4 [uncultured Caudovirales phage]CAB4187326.1 hypothetical protein UFOVP1152_8 [uncultured Caudovirales phage]
MKQKPIVTPIVILGHNCIAEQIIEEGLKPWQVIEKNWNNTGVTRIWASGHSFRDTVAKASADIRHADADSGGPNV